MALKVTNPKVISRTRRLRLKDTLQISNRATREVTRDINSRIKANLPIVKAIQAIQAHMVVNMAA